ncbi:MAG: cytochrome c3 family protein [Thermodesulfobacteriota bacterium]
MSGTFGTKHVHIVLGGGAVLLLLAAQPAAAAITGACSSCHTMHNSLNGAAINTPANGGLLLDTCAGCHTGAGTDADGLDDTTGAPLVKVTSVPAGNVYAWLPGGYFYGAAADETTFHNVDTVKSGATVTPYGWDENVDANRTAIGANWATQLTCAGTYGCHGDSAEADPAAAISGMHHDSSLREFRMLTNIAGTASSDYTVNNNGYSADTDGAYAGGKKTISYLCSECHGDFHTAANTVTAGAWVRHPSDKELTKTSPDAYDTYGTTANALDYEVPIGTDDLTTYPTLDDLSGDAIAAARKFVICLSCHYAHGSNQADLLRFDYTAMIAGTNGAGKGKGCFRCHTAKDAP